MGLKRRQFLFLGALGSLELPLLWQFLRDGSGSQVLAPVDLAGAASSIQASASPGGTPQLRFVAVADTGTGDRAQYQVADAMADYHRTHPFATVILAGDNIYNNGEIGKVTAVFEEPYKPLLQKDVRFFACLGNHDIRTDNGEPQVRYPGFNMKGRYYTFRQGPVQFFTLDTNGNADWPNQLTWLEQELKRSDAPWKVVYGHHPIYSSGLYGVNQAFVRIFTPLFERYGVQLYINGHDHDYERTQVIRGTTYLVCGAGAGQRPVGHSSWTACSADRLSFAALEVYPDRLEISGIGTDYQVFDRGTVPLRSIS